MLVAKRDFCFGGTCFKKGERVVSLTGTAFHNWLYMPGNDVVENVSDTPKQIPVDAVAAAEIDKKTKTKEA